MDGKGNMVQTGETVNMGLQRARAQQTTTSGRLAAAGPTGQHGARRYTPEQMDVMC